MEIRDLIPGSWLQDLSNRFTPQLPLQVGSVAAPAGGQCGSPSSEEKCAVVRAGTWGAGQL